MFVRIPKERVGVLVGPEGKVKQKIEEKFMVELEIESGSGGVTIILSEQAQDPSLLFKAKDTVTAIGRGFSPEHAFRLLRNEDEIFDFIDLRLVFGRSESDIRRVKGRSCSKKNSPQLGKSWHTPGKRSTYLNPLSSPPDFCSERFDHKLY